MSSSVIPVQNWACSSRWGESGWRVSGPGSIPRWLSYTWRLRSQERSPQWAPSRRSKRSFRPDQGWRGPPDSHTAVPVAAARAPASNALVPWSWVSAGNSGLLRKAGESPRTWKEVPLVWMHALSSGLQQFPFATIYYQSHREKCLCSSECGWNMSRLSWPPHGPHNTQPNILEREV